MPKSAHRGAWPGNCRSVEKAVRKMAPLSKAAQMPKSGHRGAWPGNGRSKHAECTAGAQNSPPDGLKGGTHRPQKPSREGGYPPKRAPNTIQDDPEEAQETLTQNFLPKP